MTPAWRVGLAEGYAGDAREVLAALAARSVQVCCTSPPYLGLRLYSGEQERVWGEPEGGCDHEWGDALPGDPRGGSGTYNGRNGNGEGYGRDAKRGAFCRRSGCWRGALGLEPTIALYIAHLVEVMRGVRRVLCDDGTLWLNVGDSYAGSHVERDESSPGRVNRTIASGKSLSDGLRPKSLMLIPERLAIALQDDGWVCRSRIAWAKASAMPESCTDRPSSAWEHIWLFAKKPTYFYDAEAVRTPMVRGSAGSTFTEGKTGINGNGRVGQMPRHDNAAGANLRNFWQIPDDEPLSDFWLLGPDAFPGGHFAVFPREIVRRAVSAGSSERGCCAECGAPWRRVVERERQREGATPVIFGRDALGAGNTAMVSLPTHLCTDASRSGMGTPRIDTLGWQPTCAHADAPVVPCRVLDIFGGSGTTSLVSNQLGRASVYVDLSAEYAEMARRRLESDAPMMNAIQEAEREQARQGSLL